MTMVHNLPIELLTFHLTRLGHYEYHYLVVLHLWRYILSSFISLLLIEMSIEVISFYILWLIAIAVISYIAWRRRWAVDIQLMEADLFGQKLARKEQERKYDELYDALLRTNKLNAELHKKLASAPRTYENSADLMIKMLNSGTSRDEISKKLGVNYSTVCYWIRKKQTEMWEKRMEIRQDPLM